ncbi:alanyl-tRNA editing protein [Roseateles koreensis]|uniref:Alanyl-tRNA editing protein n=1 Tax=Roseateles koreensis TaxID=2987526 RepID=A0ABT5KSZ2_9BURK|nr:alanyl-tRNA editing protein [Roseateles koreensis]MDC8786054.1 alanyl-tRNA editing protein [Roseateles koreensis]
MLDRKTLKLYYDQPYASTCGATVVRVGADYIELDQTIAFPVGGGQEADQGVIIVAGVSMRFMEVKAVYGTPAYGSEFPDVKVGGVIWHMIAGEDQGLLPRVEVGQQACVRIDVRRRGALALSHTASHLVYLGILKQRPDAINATLGCHIGTTAARFDFSIKRRFEPDDLLAITQTANELVARALPIETFAHEAVPDARIWLCDNMTIPCGGLHLSNTAPVGELVVRRRSLGAGKERIACEFPAATFAVDAYI